MAARQILIPIDDYNVDIRRILGRGTFGIVYKGHQSSSKQTVAAKHVVYQVEGKEPEEYLVNMGKNELEIFIKLKGHVNIVQLLHHHDDGESHWFIMEYCDRGDLPQYMKRENPDLLTKLNMMSACGSAVAFMHSFKPPIVHRDIKPSNVLIKREGNQDVVKVTDFGMGKLFEGTRGLVHNTMSSMVGTSSYMAPEFFGSGNALRYQPGIDVFSLGLLFMLMLDYDVTRNNWIPLSVTIAKSQKILYFGQEMSLAVSNNDPLPQLFECLSDDPVISQIQQIITDMIKYDESERIKPVEVKCRLLDILNTMLWNKFQEQQQSQTVKQSPTDVTGVSEIKDHGETTDELQIQLDSAKLEIKEMELETNDMKRTITLVREQLQQTEEQLEKSNCKNKDLESEKMQLTQVHKLETNDMKRTITSVREQLQQTGEQLEKSNCKNRDLESDKLQMTQVHELETNDMKRTITSVREQLQQTEEQLEKSNCKNRDLESDKMQMTQVHELETNDMKRTITSVREQLQQTEEQLGKSNCKNRDLESEKMQMTQVYQVEMIDLKTNVRDLQQHLEKRNTELQYVTMEMSKSKAVYQEEITGLKRENETKLGDLIQHFEDRNSENVVHQSKLESSQINVQTHTPSLPMSEVKHSDDIGIRYSGPSQFFDFEKPVAKSTVDDSGMCYASTGKYIECPICKIDFVPSATEEGISKHIEQHLVATKVCPMCNKRFSSDTDQKVFESHVQKHFYEEDPFDV